MQYCNNKNSILWQDAIQEEGLGRAGADEPNKKERITYHVAVHASKKISLSFGEALTFKSIK